MVVDLVLETCSHFTPILPTFRLRAQPGGMTLYFILHIFSKELFTQNLVLNARIDRLRLLLTSSDSCPFHGNTVDDPLSSHSKTLCTLDRSLFRKSATSEADTLYTNELFCTYFDITAEE
mmetsp:Transcript_59809/g.142411  ORF Transcript_59809/g.142411 Transcript_59809/m.142411 type:complete len:120 (-) Transcript_59809:623-982(-)